MHLSNASSILASSSNGILGSSSVTPSSIEVDLVCSNLMRRSNVAFWFSTKVTRTFETSTVTGTFSGISFLVPVISINEQNTNYNK